MIGLLLSGKADVSNLYLGASGDLSLPRLLQVLDLPGHKLHLVWRDSYSEWNLFKQ